MTEIDRLKYDTLTRQLERMRAMQYAYHRKFFGLLLVSSLVAGLCLAFPSRWTLLLVCFGVVTTGVTAAFFLHFCDFARIHARALEGRLNQLLGERLLIASQLEAEYFYPHEEPRFAPELAWPRRFFAFYTGHFCALWAALVGYAGWQLWRESFFPEFWILAFAWIVWTTVNLVFVVTWFQGAAERKMAQQLRDNFPGTH